MSEVKDPGVFGRVEEDGTVYVRTEDGERMVGQVPDVDPQQALAFYVRRFENLDTEVTLLEERIAASVVSPEEARKSITSQKKNIEQADAVGDLAGLIARLDALTPKIDELAAQRKAERAQRNEETKAAKEKMVTEAERISTGNDWRGGVNRFRALLEEWKKLPRIDKATDDDLWHRFSSARTQYTRRRKAQFAKQAEARENARVIKQQILEEARPYATSTDWGATSQIFRDLMRRWKAAGPAPREIDDKLWAEFRQIQDQFFDARSANQQAQDSEFLANQQAKEALLDEAEATILPVEDLEKAKSDFREFLEKFNSFGKVPRNAIRAIDDRVNAIERAVRDAEDAEWQRTDPQARQRAEDTIAMFEAEIAKLNKKVAQAEEKGKTKDVAKLQDSIALYQSLLDQAKATLSDFTR